MSYTPLLFHVIYVKYNFLFLRYIIYIYIYIYMITNQILVIVQIGIDESAIDHSLVLLFILNDYNNIIDYSR